MKKNKNLHKLKVKIRSAFVHIQDRWVMRYEIILLVFLLVISVTVAWYSLSVNARVQGLSLTTQQEIEFIKVSSSSGGPDLELDGQFPLIPKEEKLGPGSSGQVNLYITSLKKEVSGYELSLEEVLENGKSIDSQLLELIREHILFFGSRTGTADQYVYSNPIKIQDVMGMDKQIITGNLDTKVEQVVPIYWVWPYEYGEIPGVLETTITREAKLKYNQEDMLIGNSIDSIQFIFQVRGIIERKE